METPEKILCSLLVEQVTDVNDRRTLFEFNEVIKAMKLYANAKIDEAAEIAVDHGDIKIRNKIISLKDQI